MKTILISAVTASIFSTGAGLIVHHVMTVQTEPTVIAAPATAFDYERNARETANAIAAIDNAREMARAEQSRKKTCAFFGKSHAPGC